MISPVLVCVAYRWLSTISVLWVVSMFFGGGDGILYTFKRFKNSQLDGVRCGSSGGGAEV